MTELTRRSLLAGTAVAGAALSLEGFTLARAAAPAATAQAPGFYRQKVGDYEITALSDGARTFPMPDTFVVNKKKEEALAAAEGAYMPKGQGRGRPDERQHEGRRHRSECGRHRADLAFPRRPHRRTAHGGWQADLSECRDHGAGTRMGVLDRRGERRQGERL
jgi:hypothetical protein